MTTADCVLAGVPIFNPAIPDPGGEWSLADDFEEHGETVATLLSGELAQDWEAATRDLIVHDCEFDALISTKTWRS